MVKAGEAHVAWDSHSKRWSVRIQVGEEVVKRSAEKDLKPDAGDDQLRSMAVEIANNEGYDLERSAVTIAR